MSSTFLVLEIEGSSSLDQIRACFFTNRASFFKSRIIVEALTSDATSNCAYTSNHEKKAGPTSGNHKLIVSSLQMTSPREKGCVTEIFKPPARFSVHLECDPAFECALFTLCIYPLKKSIVFLAKHPSPTGIVFNFIPCFKSRIVL